MPKDYGIEHEQLLPHQKELRPRLFALKYSPARKLDEKTFLGDLEKQIYRRSN